jgi:uncharacterized protein (TIGR02118 family)
MVKMISLVRRHAELTRDEFAKVWLEDYVHVASRLPGVRRYVVNVVAAASEEQEWDGFAELWFDSREDFDAAFAEPELAEELERGRQAFIYDHRVYLVTETVVTGAQA